MDRRLPSLVASPHQGFVLGALVIAGFAMAGCGSRNEPAAPGETVSSSMEPIDAVPLPLDGSGPTPTPAAETVSKPVDKTEVAAVEAEVPSDAADEIATDPAIPGPKIIVTPRASIPTEPTTPASPQSLTAPRTPAAEAERPVLNF